MREIILLTVVTIPLLFSTEIAFAATDYKPEVSLDSSLSKLKLSHDESAEEILLRAYQGDSGAISLVSAGYLTGSMGFPQNLYLAQAWSEAYYGLTDLETEKLSTQLFGMVMETKRGPDDRVPWSDLAGWEYARKSVAAQGLGEAGIIDFESITRRFRQKVNSKEHQREYYQEEKEKLEKIAQYRSLAIKTIRELRSRKMTEADAKILEPDDGMKALSYRALIRYVATDDEPGNGYPEWKLEYINQFIAMRSDKEEPELAGSLAYTARNEAQRLILEGREREYLLELLRRAHSGDAWAIRQVAFAHASGELMMSYEMYFQWLTFGAVHQGDVTCMELLAEHFANNSYYSPGLFVFPMRTEYLWAKLAMHYGDKETKERMKKLLDLTEKKYKRSDARSLDAAVAGLIKNMEAGKGLIWLK